MNNSLPEIILTETWDMSQTEIRNKIQDLQDACLQLPQVETPVKEFFSDGTYGRQMMIPKGTVLVGEIHATPWIIVVSRGKISVRSEEGLTLIDATKEPVTFISPAGVKRAGYAHEDTWWTGFRATDKLCEADIRKEHIVDSYKQLEDRTLCGESQQPKL